MVEMQATIYKHLSSSLATSVKEIGLIPYAELLGYYDLEMKQDKDRAEAMKKAQKNKRG